MEIKTSGDWWAIEQELKTQLKSMNYNSDLYKMKDNITVMVVELNKAEVTARRLKNFKYLEPKIAEINSAINNLEKWILMLILSQ
jgi:hypothetical protein